AANFGGQKVAAIVTDTENFGDAVAGWEQGVQQSGLNYYRTLRHPKGDTSWYNTFALELAQNDVDIVYVNSSPVDYLRFAQQASGQGFRPQYVGVGITMGLNALLGSGCGEGAPVDGGIFFSPFPGLDWARDNEPEFFEAAGRFGTPSDDIALALWAQGKILAQLLESYEATYGSNDVTREDFRNLVETSQVSTGVFPDLAYSAEDHFGADTVHVLQADCSAGEHRTLATFASGF
ncbi:MAG TPA: ABC transporter substrate-binding protein, partial [Euzebya sp.]|nr:ABC transporter substrate-binding protein [Euzebya sp.]